MPVDFMAVLQAGQGLVPDMREQLFQDRQRRQQSDVNNLKIEQARQTQQRQGQLQQDLAGAVQSGDPRAIARLMAKYPEFADQIKPGWEALSKDAQQTNITQTGVIYERVRNGDVKGAADMLRKRYEADLAAGQADETTKEVIDALDSGDPQQIKVAAGTLGIMLAAATGEKFTDTYGKLNPTDAIDPLEKKYNFILRTKGQEAADRFLAVQSDEAIAVQAGGSVFKKSDILGVGGGMGGGIRPTREQEAESERVRAIFPNAPEFATDNPRGGDQSTGMGGVPAPALGANGMPTTLTPQQYQAIVDVKGKAATDAWAQRNGVTVQGASQQPVRVRSVQEARKLPSGTMFVTPDGRTMRKP